MTENIVIDLYSNLKNHKDSKYIQDEMSEVLSKALVECYESQPIDPVKYIADYLLNHNQTIRNVKKFQELQEDKERLSRKLEEEEKERQKELLNLLKSDEAYSKLEKEFFERVKEPEDAQELASEMCQHLSTFTGAGGTYIYELKHVCRLAANHDKMEDPVTHEGYELRVVAADEEHLYMLENKLPLKDTLTGLFFQEDFQGYEGDTGERKEDEEEDNKDEEEGMKKQVKRKRYYDEEDPELKEINSINEKEDKFLTIFIPQVICDRKIHFFRVPKLGCYYGVAYDLQCCLTLESLESAFNDLIDVKKRKEDNEDKRLKYEEALRAWNETKQGDKPEDPDYESEQVKPLAKIARRFALVVDTLGQDRMLKSDQREYIRRTLRVYKKHYEQSEEEHLNECCEVLIQQISPAVLKDYELDYKVHRENTIRDMSSELPYEPESKEVFYTYETIKATLLSDNYWNLFCELKNMKLIKYPQIFTSLFYIYLNLSKEEINVKDTIYGVTNNLDWINQRKYLDQRLHEAVKTWSPRGPKAEPVHSYRRLGVIEEHLNELNDEEIKKFSFILSLWRLLILQYIKCRRADADYRNKERAKKIEEIEKDKEALEEFNKRKQNALDNEQEWAEEFTIEIKAYPEEEVDNDLLEAEHAN